jgi:hypothetical protein
MDERWPWSGPPTRPPRSDEQVFPWVDQLAQNILLTVQAAQRLHTALDGKFSR